MTEWRVDIPTIVLAEHETQQHSNEIERCPCGSSLFRLYSEIEGTIPEPGSEINWWQVCAICGGRKGGFTQTFTEKGDTLQRVRG